jgi:hypothetical protein
MLTPAEIPDSQRGGMLFAQIPLLMGAPEARRVFEQPLRQCLEAQGIEFKIRSFLLPARQDRPQGIGIEIKTDQVGALAPAIEKLAELGAPPATLIEIEHDQATIEMSLAEATAN